jgi:hypothetical protein
MQPEDMHFTACSASFTLLFEFPRLRVTSNQLSGQFRRRTDWDAVPNHHIGRTVQQNSRRGVCFVPTKITARKLHISAPQATSRNTVSQKFGILDSSAIPVRGRGGLQGCEMLRIPHLDNRLTDGATVVSPTHRPHFAPHKHIFFLMHPVLIYVIGWVNSGAWCGRKD